MTPDARALLVRPDQNGTQLHNRNHPWCNFLNRKLLGYWKIAQAAVRKEPRAIVWVPFTYSRYLRLAEAALAEYHHSKAAHLPGTSDNRTWFLAYVVFKQLDQWPHGQARELRRELVKFATTTLAAPNMQRLMSGRVAEGNL